MKLAQAIILMLVAAIMTPAFLAAEVQPEITYDFYEVPYVPGLSINEMIKRVSPLIDNQNGHRVIGLNKWFIRYNISEPLRPKIDICRLNNPTVTTSCAITLPQLVGGNAQTIAEFNKLVEDTKIHELEHCTIATQHANIVQNNFRNMPDYPCRDLAGEVSKIFDKIMDDCKREQSRFDHAEYKYKQHLYLESLQSMMDAGFNVIPPSEGDWAPRLDTRAKAPLKNLPQAEDDIEQQGIYRDENGVWRNY